MRRPFVVPARPGVLPATRVVALATCLSCLLLAESAAAAPVTLEFSGTIFGVTDPTDVFVTTSPNTYSLSSRGIRTC